MQPPALLGLLGAALAAAVGSLPVDTRNHNEEMVTRCIIEVLSNALSRSRAPPITPECRRVLKTSGNDVKDEEKNKSEDRKFEVRLLRDPAEAPEARPPAGREDAPEAATRGPESRAQGGARGGELARGPLGRPQPSRRQASQEAKASRSEAGEEHREGGEAEKHQKRERGEDGSEEQHLEESGEAHDAGLKGRKRAAAEKEEALVGRQDGRPEERTHSRESGEEAPEGSEAAAVAEVAKRRSRPRHHHGRSRPDRAREGEPSSEEGGRSREDSEESDEGNATSGETRPRHSAHARAWAEQPEYGEAARNHQGVRAPEDPEGERHVGRGSEELKAPRPRGEASREEGDSRSRPSPGSDNMAQGYDEEREEGRARAGEPGASAGPDVKEEKRFLGEAHHHGQGSQVDKARRRPQGEWEERDPSYLSYGEGNGEEGGAARPRLQGLQDSGESREEARRAEQDGRHGAGAQRRSWGQLLSPRYAPPRPGSGRSERKDSLSDKFLDGEEENELILNEKSFFPEYSYDWWEKQPLAEDVTWGHEKRSPAGAPMADWKRQYSRVAELDRLLDFRKKAAEVPGFYAAGTAEDRPGQGARAAEQEKELENLAAMDLELQKIAEKFSGNWRG